MAYFNAHFFSSELGMATEACVILPERAEGQIGMAGGRDGQKYKVLYLLHGMSDDQTIWMRRTSIERYASDYNLAVVMPTTGLGWYTDMAHGQKWWTYLTRELPAMMRDFFPNMSDKREDTFAAGLSMGGYGALKCGLRAGEVFSNVATLSGAVMTPLDRGNIDNAGKKYFEDIFGPLEEAKGSFNDLWAAAEELAAQGGPLPRIYQWCGTEDFLYQHNVQMRDHLQELGYDLTYSEYPGDHQWKYWDEQIKKVLEWLPLKEKG